MKQIEELNRDLLIKQFNEYKVETFVDLQNIVNYLKIKIDNSNHPFLEKTIFDLGLSSRAFNCVMHFLQSNKLYDTNKEKPCVKHIINISLERFKQFRNVGYRTVTEIELLLNQHGYSFKP